MATTPNLGLPLIDSAMTADVPRDMNALANAVDSAVEEALADVSIPDASLTVKGKVQLSNSTNGTSQALAATEKAVNDARVSVVSDYIRQPGFASTGGTSTAYTATLTPTPTTLPDGFGITIVPHIANGASPTLNVNGLGAVPLKDQKGIAYAAGKLAVGKPYTFRKVGSDFLADSSGGSGNAVAGDIRAGKTATNDAGDVTGSLVVRNTSQTNVTPTTSAQTLQPGIYDYPIVVAGVPAATADLVTQTQSVPANSSRAFNYATQPNIAFVTTSASMAQQHAMMLLGPTPRINHNGTVLFTDTLNPNAYNSALSYSNWNGSSYQIYNNNGVAANLTVEAYFKR
ncbi:Phage tail fibre repeat-containing protein [Paenibacillus sp. CF095]|uniref:phage tail protein n=1 Tax=Paenibacillus sp. CF095 TaxID=1881033 RepID=UPI0008883A1E|nr:phage tail protein [Paenibacillus sp. CF095]SDC86712.1 Phage tail fibre repeat-containing protein [Paenibacillus sp. CF095]